MNRISFKQNRLGLTVAAISLSSLGLVACGSSDNDNNPEIDSSPVFSATVQRTEFGIPHIEADDYLGLGYGLGFSFAQDNICSLANEIVTAEGTRSLFFGDTAANNRTDFFYNWYNTSDRRNRFLAAQQPEVRDAIKGYAAGYSRYLRDTGIDNIDPTCAGEDWVREIDENDLAAVYNKGNLRGGLANFVAPIVSAQPPDAAGSASVNSASNVSFDLSNINVTRGGSNAYGLGAEVTENGRGMLYGNPHEPWQGVQRFYQFHLTIPGEIDVMGAGQQGQPFVNIGFNKDVAWSHTVSTAKRFTLYQLQLVDGNPLKYEYTNADGEMEERDIERVDVTIPLPDGATKAGTVYTSHFGPMVAVEQVNGNLPPWGAAGTAFTIRDAASENPRPINQWFSMNKATGVDDLESRIKETLGLPFVNTIAADRFGKAMFADLSTVPNVSSTKFSNCIQGQPLLQAIAQAGIPALDGSTADCEWGSDDDSPQRGILGGANLPVQINETYLTNHNDSYWLSNPANPLTGDFSPLLRRNLLPMAGVNVPEASPRTLRTRMGIVQVQDRLSGSDGLGGNSFNLQKLQEVGYSNRSYAAELVLDDVLTDCFADTALPVSGGGTIDGTQGCNVLANWDRRNDLGSRGAHVFREFARNIGFNTLLSEGTGFEVGFDETDPVNTPRDLTINETTRQALGDAIKLFNDLGVALDEQLGNLQFETDESESGVRIPMHGGRGDEGVFNVLRTPNVNSDGEYTPAVVGPTYMQTVTFDDNGPVAEALLGFSQSADSTRPFHRDQTRRYSAKNWISQPFSDEEIATKALGEPRVLTE